MRSWKPAIAVLVMVGPLLVATPAAGLHEICDQVAPTLVGTTGNDVIVGTPGPDVIFGLAGKRHDSRPRRRRHLVRQRGQR